jgi:hypothetical protein
MGGHTPLVQISTSIITEGVVRDVIRNSAVDLGLIITGAVDSSILGRGFRFDARFQIFRAADNGRIFDHWWSGGNYPVMVDGLPGGGSSWWIMVNTSPASGWGLNDGEGGWAEGNNEGMYLFRAYFFVDTSTYTGSLFRPNGTSEFAFADDHPFWVE